MSSAKVLVILEGEQPEGNTLARLQRAFPEELADISEDLVRVVYMSNVYALYAILKENDGFLDITEVLKERFSDNAVLQDLKREDVAQIFLFFDLDIHGKFLDEACSHLSELVDFFDNETENGKLFLSYPMVEAVNICDDSTGLMSEDRKLFKIENCRGNGFKKFANNLNRDSKSICRANSRENWSKICKANYEKAGWLMGRSDEAFEVILDEMTQRLIFDCQRKLILGEQTVATLGAFPFFLLEYLGSQKTMSILRLSL